MTDQDLSTLVCRSAEALARAGLVHAYGHCSARIDDEHFLVTPSKAMSRVRVGDPCVTVSVEGALPDGVLGEVRAHQQIYRLRPDVRGICRFFPPKIMSVSALGRTPKPRHGFGSFFAQGAPLWTDPVLIRDDVRAAALAKTLGGSNAIVMRGNGAITAAQSLQHATVLAWYLEDAARVELDVLASGVDASAFIYSEAETTARATWSGGIMERMWDHLTAS